MTTPLAINIDPDFRVEHLGSERQPLVTIENCLESPDAVLAIAARSAFSRHGPHYPGIRSPVPRAACDVLIGPLGTQLVQTFNLPSLPEFDECFLSVVTTQAQELQPIQRLPHFDGLEPDRLAFLLYLDRRERGGTAFYRQRSSGFETVDESRFDAFRNCLERDTALHGLPAKNYIRGDTELYEQIGQVSEKFNRAIIYRGNSLHCADLPSDFEPLADPLSGRLTLNLFLRANR